MKEKRKKLIETFCSWNFIKFLVIGAFNTLNGTVIAYLYSLMFDVNLAFILGYITSLIIAYILNSVWNFKTQMTGKGLWKFVVSYMPNFFVQNGVVIVLYNILEFHKVVAYLMAAILGIPVTYILIKVFVFNKKE